MAAARDIGDKARLAGVSEYPEAPWVQERIRETVAEVTAAAPLDGEVLGEFRDDDDADYETCSHCGGEWYLQECDDPIQCCDPRCDGQWHPCVACQGTGLAKHQVIW